jgi:hypothetical protein
MPGEFYSPGIFFAPEPLTRTYHKEPRIARIFHSMPPFMVLSVFTRVIRNAVWRNPQTFFRMSYTIVYENHKKNTKKR